jgi:N-acetylglucosaminyldiphosphoundecaprenol N-acetyl-beta-D-mannosaminyltransferase
MHPHRYEEKRSQVMQAIQRIADSGGDSRDIRASASYWDDFSRQVYCVLGIPIDAIDMPALLRAIANAVAEKSAFLVSTPNLNFLVQSQTDPEFRETVLLSEICPADGMAIVWIARLLGLPIKERVAGSDMLEALKQNNDCSPRLKLFLFGGAEGVVDAAAKALNRNPSGLSCVGFINPGYGTIEEMSQEHIIQRINASDADFLIASLTARKGQLWLQHNHHRLQIPVRAHLGAAVNFEAGKLRRAPSAIRKIGLEWLFRIKEEPHLWRRYWDDGRKLLGLFLTHILPLVVRSRWNRLRRRKPQGLRIECAQDFESVTLTLFGSAAAPNVEEAVGIFRDAVAARKNIQINLSNTCAIDARFLGLILMLRKQAKKQGTELNFMGVSERLQTMFRLNGAKFLLASAQN